MSVEQVKVNIAVCLYESYRSNGHAPGSAISGCCGSNVVPVGGIAMPMGINLGYNGVIPAVATEAVKHYKHDVEPYLEEYEWHEHRDEIPELGISYSLIIADTFYNHEDYDDDDWDD